MYIEKKIISVEQKEFYNCAHHFVQCMEFTVALLNAV